ncbi:MAG: triphosphoribosyl-dephospho-CoA synthase CitG [Clostridium sp.]
MYDISFKLSELAIQSMMYEVSCFPSPGLVSPVSNGAHKDMNFYTFIDSTAVLNKYMFLFSEVGLNAENLEELFKGLRKVGIDAEKAMFEKTENINTHKGMIFLMGLTIGSTAFCIKNNLGFFDIKKNIEVMCKDITKELIEAEGKSESERSHGEKLYIKYGVTGVRGEAEKGIPSAFNNVMEYEKAKNLNENDRLIQTLFHIMKECEDSTILHRHNFKVLEEVRAICKEVIDMGGLYNPNMKEYVIKLNENFIERNISPGGSADILAVTVFLSLVKKNFSNFSI